MYLNKLLNLAKVMLCETDIFRQCYIRLEPELCFAVGRPHMNVHSALYSREEKEPITVFRKNRGAQLLVSRCWILSEYY